VILPWWERFPGTLEQERDAFQRAGMPARINSDWQAAGVIRLEFTYESDTQTIPLYAIYPDLFPYVRPQVYAADLDLPRHRNPFAGNLCLIGRSTEYWSTHDRLADLVVDQMPKLLAAARRPAGDPSPVPEEDQAEPITGYMPWPVGGIVLVDSGWQIPEHITSGTLTLVAEATERSFKACITRLAGDGLELVGLRDLSGVWDQGRGIEGRWVRLASPPRSFDPGELLRAAAGVDPGVTRPDFRNTGRISVDLLGIAFPEQLRPEVTGTGWLFVVRYRQPSGTFMVRAGRAGEGDFIERIPELAGLRHKKALLVGLGGIGAPVAMELIRAGLGEVRVVDHDVVEPGPIVRWPLGLLYAGESKVAALEHFARVNWPYAKVIPARLAIGAVRENLDEPSDREQLDALLDGVDLVFDATAELGIHYLLADLARDRGIPYVEAATKNGAWGGRIARLSSSPGSACRVCLQYTLEEVDADPDRQLRVKPGGLHQPLGCADPTFTGTGFDVASVALAGARLAVGTLLRGIEGGYPDPIWDVATINFRDASGGAIEPTWRTFRLQPHPSCQPPRGH
jgi:predicted ThiF/HesA family dinucleotide-utilizing enzyme